ncbi:unnamed protein product [Polarella glacialis]|uniref:Uncharacterized protein n=1 Tax=Polarella glacialis TaxID=89957 RepID=A0A813EA63_POLGL|nr:unnamed protein product [Polarella glacialis]CAE8598751.1 unnamed protein product [Polarella glacialis]CAE8692410.1 unnamed protein product [Polarella glacialis]
MAAANPQFAANVGQAVDTLRRDHAQIPRIAPGLNVVDPKIILELAQAGSLRFEGLPRYREFWDNFRTGVELVSTASSSEVVNVVQSGLYLRIRWKLVLVPRNVQGQATAGALGAARGMLGDAASGFKGGAAGSGLGGWLQGADDLLGKAQSWAQEAETSSSNAKGAAGVAERTVEMNSIYELDCWSGKVVRHTLEFRTPEEDFGLLGAMQGIPSFR